VARVEAAKVEAHLGEARGRGPRWRGIAVGVCIAVLVVLLASRMVPHPVGPARTLGKYRGKAATTAKAAGSDVNTVLLVARAASAGKAFGPYTALVVSYAEESVSGVQGTFDSIQPPDVLADALRSQLDDLLSDALDHVSRVRIAARRGQLAQLEEVAQPLVQDARKLQAFMDEHQ
jgi:hypothetical protein